MTEINNKTKIAVIGGGAAGMMAAGTATEYGAEVTVYEHTDRLGKKLAITGKGRCNVTNMCDVNEFLENVPKNPRFLYTALNAFSPKKTYSFFEDLGVDLVVERGNRVFPENGKAKTIVDAMRKHCRNAKIVYDDVTNIIKDGSTFSVVSKGGRKELFNAVIIATGGKSYPLTGSDGSGYNLAIKLGHTVTELKPSLVPIESPSSFCCEMMGLSLKNVAIKILDQKGRSLYEDFGEMMFTHFGVTGPIILSASSHLGNVDISSLTLSIDLKPALDLETLDKRLLSDFKANLNKDFKNSLSALLPSKMIEPFIKYTKVSPFKKVNSITKEERATILNAFKDFRIQ